MALVLLAISLCASSALAETPLFVRDLLPVLEKAQCMECHQFNGVASTTRLQFPESGASSEEMEAFGDTLRKLVDRANPANSLLLMKPTNRAKHGGGLRIKPGSDEEVAVKAWIDHLLRTPASPGRTFARARTAKEQTVLRRLTHSQYDSTVRDLVGDHTFPSRQFPPEDFIDGFKNQYEGQSISPILAESYLNAAERVAANWQGKDPGPSFVKDFGLRAFRRPLTAEEEKRYSALYAQGKAKLVMEAMLQSPQFLFRLEATSNPAHKPYARAARLSYILWDTMPDEALLKATASGELDTAKGVEGAARRMLSDPRARQSADEFIAQWLRFDTVVTMVKERRAYPMFTREMALAMTEETRRLAADLIWSDKSFMDLFTAGYTFLNADLAALYRLSAPAEEFAKVSFPADSDRAGILGHATFLALTSKPADTSITARGLFVREQFLCQHVPQPPPGVNVNLPVQRADKPMTNRERLSVHLTNASCASCHNLIDPIGYGLEKYDGVGARREKLKVDLPRYDRRQDQKTVEIDIDASGWVTGIQSSEFNTAGGLGRVLAANPQCQECVVKQYFRYALGRHEGPADRPTIERISADFRKSGFRFQDMMISLVRWTEFPPSAELARNGKD